MFTDEYQNLKFKTTVVFTTYYSFKCFFFSLAKRYINIIIFKVHSLFVQCIHWLLLFISVCIMWYIYDVHEAQWKLKLQRMILVFNRTPVFCRRNLSSCNGFHVIIVNFKNYFVFYTILIVTFDFYCVFQVHPHRQNDLLRTRQ